MIPSQHHRWGDSVAEVAPTSNGTVSPADCIPVSGWLVTVRGWWPRGNGVVPGGCASV